MATHICNSLPPDNNNLDIACQGESGSLAGELLQYYLESNSFPNVIVYYTVNDDVWFDVYQESHRVTV